MAIVLFMLALLLSSFRYAKYFTAFAASLSSAHTMFFLIEDGRTIKSQGHIPERHFCGQKFGESA